MTSGTIYLLTAMERAGALLLHTRSLHAGGAPLRLHVGATNTHRVILFCHRPSTWRPEQHLRPGAGRITPPNMTSVWKDHPLHRTGLRELCQASDCGCVLLVDVTWSARNVLMFIIYILMFSCSCFILNWTCFYYCSVHLVVGQSNWEFTQPNNGFIMI